MISHSSSCRPRYTLSKECLVASWYSSIASAAWSSIWRHATPGVLGVTSRVPALDRRDRGAYPATRSMVRTGQGRDGRRRLVELDGIRRVSPAEWDALVGDESPFLEWAWLASLEESGAASAATGWTPRHLTLWDGEQLMAASAVYEKSHSIGEFVFDQGWARASERAGIPYYPKLVVGVPMTPITG